MLAESELNLKRDFYKISIDEYNARHANCDMYILLKNGKLIKFINKGEPLPAGRLERYKKHNLKHLYVRQSEYDSLLGHSKSYADNESFDLDVFESQIDQVRKLMGTFANFESVDEKTIRKAHLFLETSLKSASKNKTIQEVISNTCNAADMFAAHNLFVSYLCLMIGEELGISSPSARFKLSLAALFHDQALITEEEGVVFKHYYPDLEVLKSHSISGAKALDATGMLASDVIFAIRQHHEFLDGSGYPKGLRDREIHQFAKIISVCDIFSAYTLKFPNLHQLAPYDAFLLIKPKYNKKLCPKVLDGLKSLFKL